MSEDFLIAVFLVVAAIWVVWNIVIPVIVMVFCGIGALIVSAFSED